MVAMLSSVMLFFSFLQYGASSFSLSIDLRPCFRESFCVIPSCVAISTHRTASTKPAQSHQVHESSHHEAASNHSKVSSSTRALSSTLPWTIRLSLAVLWGVCWKFYYPADDFDGRVNNNSQSEQYAVDWNQIQESYRESSEMNLRLAPTGYQAQPTMMEAATSHVPEQVVGNLTTSSSGGAGSRARTKALRTEALARIENRPTPHRPNRDLLGTPSRRPGLALTSSSQASRLDSDYRSYYSHEPQDLLDRPNVSPRTSWSLVSGDNVGLDALSVAANAEAPTYNTGHLPQAAERRRQGDSRLFDTNQQVVPYDFQLGLPNSNRVAPSSSESVLSPYLAQRFGKLEMVEDLAYAISPRSDDHYSRRTSSIDIKLKMEQLAQGDEPASTRAQPQTFKRDRTPPRNSKDEIICDHSDCINKGEIFNRTCEWNKHMDKHERPYKCLERGCERLLGFTYSGGLLRHNREVHKKNLSTRTPLYCPFPNCNRNSGSGHGFTRQENLNEHQRRRHVGEEAPTQAPSTWPPESPDQKRKRNLDAEDEPDSESDEATDDDKSPVTKRPRTASDQNPQHLIQQLRSEIRQKDAYIESLRTTIRLLQQQNSVARGPADGKWA